MSRKPQREPRVWNIVLVPDEKKQKDIPVNFPPFDISKMGLELLEATSKLKANPPAVEAITLRRPKPDPSAARAEAVEKAEAIVKKASGKSGAKAKPKPADSDDEFSKALSIASSSAAEEESSDEEVLPKSLQTSGSDDEGDDIDDDDDEAVSDLLLTDEDDADAEGEGGGGAVATGGADPVTPEKTPAELKTELLRKWKILEMRFPSSAEVKRYSFGEEDPYDVIKKAYDEVVWDLTFKSKIQDYRRLLGVYFGGVEFISSNLLDIDMTGFGYSQSQAMTNTYDELLVELGEKSGASFYSKLPVEVRLLFTLGFQTAIFFAFRYVHNNKGAAYGAMFRQQFGIASPEPPPKPRMAGPSITPEDLERLRREAEAKED